MMDTSNTRRMSDQLFSNVPDTDHKEAGLIANGVRAPSVGDASYEVWSALNNLKAWGAIPSVVTAARLAATMKRDVNATVVTYLQWAKFHAADA